MDEPSLGSSGLQGAVIVSKVFLSRKVAAGRAELCDFLLNLSISDRQAPPPSSIGVISQIRAKTGGDRTERIIQGGPPFFVLTIYW